MMIIEIVECVYWAFKTTLDHAYWFWKIGIEHFFNPRRLPKTVGNWGFNK